jgi:hypothetical protein
MYIIFLDIDGVLNTEHGLKLWSNNWKNPELMRNSKDDKKQFCPEAVEVLRRIIETTGAKIVISSTWTKPYLMWLSAFIFIVAFFELCLNLATLGLYSRWIRPNTLTIRLGKYIVKKQLE